MSAHRWLLLLTSTLLLPLSSPPLTSQAERPAPPPPLETVSLVALIANPDPYEGKRVQVVGVLDIGFEVDALCLTIEHTLESAGGYCAAVGFKGLRRDGTGTRWKEWMTLSEWSKEYVVIEGTMGRSEGLSPIVIRDVTRVAPVPFEAPIEWRADTPENGVR